MSFNSSRPIGHTGAGAFLFRWSRAPCWLRAPSSRRSGGGDSEHISRGGGVLFFAGGMFRLKLEIFRMVLYLSFPIAMFWFAGEMQIFQESLNKPKMFPPDKDYTRMELESFKEWMRKKHEAERLQAGKD
nr:protein PET100 homolog, mitochondrial [Pogona vitticeps]